MTTSDSAYTRPVRLSRRSTQGVIVGLDVWASSTIAVSAGIAIVSTLRYGIAGLLVSALLWVPLGVSAFIPIQGMTMPKMAVLWMSKQVRHATGGTRTRFRPERPLLAGTLNLPGNRANVQVWDVGGMAAAYNPADRSVSITAELEVDGFLMLDFPDRYDLSQQWATVLASFTQRTGIKRVTLQERTVPTTIQPAREFYADTVRRRKVDDSTPVAVNYQQVMDRAEAFAVSHRNYITLTIDLLAMQGQLKSMGGGKTAIQALAEVEAGNVSAALASARLTVRKWLNVREWAALGRTAFDPDYLAIVQNRSGVDAGVDLAAIGPMALEEPRRNNGIVKSDSGWHSTMWIHEWPRSQAQVGFVEPLVFARHPLTNDAVTHIFTVVLTPVSVKKALKRIRTEKKVWRGNQRIKAKRSEHNSAEDLADWDALEAQEESIVQGQGEYRYGGYLTVSAADEETLQAAIAGSRNAMSRVGMEGQILYCQQAEALMVNALPLGMVLK